MPRVKPGSAQGGLRFIVVSVLGCALLLGGASVEDVQIITRAGQKQMLAKPGTEAAGARNPDVTVVEYFDYNCPACRRS